MTAPNLGRVKNHAEQALEKLTASVKQPNTKALQAAFTKQLQDVEDALWDVLLSRMLTWEPGYQIPFIGAPGADTIVDASNDALDQLGALVGEPRKAREDVAYRAAIRVRLRALHSKGSDRDVLEVIKLAIPSATSITRTIEGPATATISLDSVPDGAEQSLIDSVAISKPQGVAVALVYGLDSYPPDPVYAGFVGQFSSWVIDQASTGEGLNIVPEYLGFNSWGNEYGTYFGKVTVL